MPLVSQTFDQLLDFTRTSAATFVGSNGLIQNTPASVNLLTWTQQFDSAAWTKNGSTVTANTTVAPDGTSTADTIEATVGGAGAPRVYQRPAITGGTTYTISSYFKASGTNFAFLSMRTGGANWTGAEFDLSTGTVTRNAITGNVAYVGATISDAGNGWYRCTVTVTPTDTIAAGVGFIFFGSSDGTSPFVGGFPTFTNTGTETVFVWGAQLEAASAASTYTRNNGGVFPPRFDYDPVTLAAKGLLIEEQRANLYLQSEAFDNASWVKTEVTATANATTSPDGTSDAELLVPSVNAFAHQVYQSVALTNATAYTATVYAKAGGYNFVNLRFGGGIASEAFFDLSNGTVVSATTLANASIRPAGNGWYRCSYTATATSTTSFAVSINPCPTSSSYGVAGNGTSGIFLWGAQLEAGAFATSYIPTVASQVTRTGDFTSIVAPNFAPWFNPSEGTFVVEYSRYQNADAFGIVLETKPASTSTADRFAVAATSTADPRMQLYPNGSSVLDTTSTFGVLAVNTVVKGALAYRSGDSAATRGGASPSTSATAFATPAHTGLQIGSTDNGTYGSVTTTQLNGHIRSIRYYPTRLSNSQLQALTS